MKPQEWCCEGCGVAGTAAMPEHIDALGGFYRVEDSHSDLSPGCRRRDLIRVRNYAMCSDAEWEETKRKAATLARELAS